MCGVVVVVVIAAPANRRVEAKPEQAGPRGLKARTVMRRRRPRSWNRTGPRSGADRGALGLPPERRRRQLAGPRGARLACQPSEQSPEQDSPSHLVAPHPNPTTERLQKNPAGERGFSQCAREDSNLHGPSVHKALNLARLPIPPQALGTASIARQNGSVLGRRYLTEHMFA